MALTTSDRSLDAAITDYLAWHNLRGSSARHRDDLKRILRAFLESVGGDAQIQAVSRPACESFLQSFRERGCKPNTLKAYHRVLDAFFNWLLEEERIETSPMKRVPKPKLPDEHIQPLTGDELTRLLSQPDLRTFTGVRDAAFMALLADTGLRVSEALGLRIADLNAKDRSINLVGKGSRIRTVFYGETAARCLKDYLRRHPTNLPEDCVFLGSLGEPMLRFNMSSRIHSYGERAGITGKRVSPHTLRHTFAVSWLMGGGDAFSLQRLLGHSSSEMTSRYVRFASKDLATLHRAISPLDRLHSNDRAGGPQVERRRRLR